MSSTNVGDAAAGAAGRLARATRPADQTMSAPATTDVTIDLT
jgi:hypothetical protein